MRKGLIGLIFIWICSAILISEGLDNLAQGAADKIINFLKSGHNVSAGFVSMENFTELSDRALQNFYQILAAKMEAAPDLNFNDLMVNINDGKGVFNTDQTRGLTHLISLKLIRNRDKIGLGFWIFSKMSDRVVHTAYQETTIKRGEIELLISDISGFKAFGFSQVREINARPNLLDIQSIKMRDDSIRYFFYYPDEIVIFTVENNSLNRYFTFKLEWGRPYYPVLKAEGKCSLFYLEKDLYLTAGNNFSPHTKMFRYRDSEWEEMPSLDFVPFSTLTINRNFYIAGGRYEDGKNYFQDLLVLMPVVAGRIDYDRLFKKDIPPFYSLDFSFDGSDMDSLHLIDLDYNYRYFSASFAELTVDQEKRGSEICLLDSSWVITSDFSNGRDRLYFYDIRSGGRQLIYENELAGEVGFISTGEWSGGSGIWVYLKLPAENGDGPRHRLQFWRKDNE